MLQDNKDKPRSCSAPLPLWGVWPHLVTLHHHVAKFRAALTWNDDNGVC